MLIEIARTEGAELVVTGRRGRGGFAELLLGSTSHQLTHHVDRPLVIVP
jgi:nucleotide-binding universal stress UspA family protein